MKVPLLNISLVNTSRPRYGIPKMMVHLDHPCYGVDMATVEYADDERALRGQGYVDLDEIQELTGRSFEIDESNNFPFETWEWLQERK